MQISTPGIAGHNKMRAVIILGSTCALVATGMLESIWEVFQVVGVAFAAVCVWLVARIVNRRERWAKWTLPAMVIVPTLYILSFGPACWIASQPKSGFQGEPPGFRIISIFYWPIWYASGNGPKALRHSIFWYAKVGMSPGTFILVPFYRGDQNFGLKNISR
jgi:hypothetical protein